MDNSRIRNYKGNKKQIYCSTCSTLMKLYVHNFQAILNIYFILKRKTRSFDNFLWMVAPVAEAELVLALLLFHRAVAVQVVEASPLLPPLSGGRGFLWRPVLLAVLLHNDGHVLPSVARDVCHVLAPTSSCGLTHNYYNITPALVG